MNPFLANRPILYPLRAPENQRLFGVFRGYKMDTWARNGLKDQNYTAENNHILWDFLVSKLWETEQLQKFTSML